MPNCRCARVASLLQATSLCTAGIALSWLLPLPNPESPWDTAPRSVPGGSPGGMATLSGAEDVRYSSRLKRNDVMLINTF